MLLDFIRDASSLSDRIRERADHHVHVGFQPKVDLAARKVAGYEALLRWQEPNGAFLSPEFILRAADNMGPAVRDRLFSVIVGKVCECVARVAPEQRMPVAINASPNQIGWVLGDIVRRKTSAAQIDPALIEIEVTEQAPIGEIDDFRTRLADIMSLGLNVWLDDFGVGHSQLSNLLTIKPHGVKLDRFFIANAATHEGRVLVRSIIRICHDLDMKVVVEGVETPAQHAFVLCSHADYGQGYLYRKPAMDTLPDAMVPGGCEHYTSECDKGRHCCERLAPEGSTPVEVLAYCPGLSGVSPVMNEHLQHRCS